jgi:serine/threonine protein kinase
MVSLQTRPSTCCLCRRVYCDLGPRLTRCQRTPYRTSASYTHVMVISRKYEVQGQLGRGSMGVVYKVRHTTLDTLSALKVLPPQLAEIPELVKRFHREARVMARLNHPNIVRVIDIDRDEALHFHYFVMEYICGQTLREYLQKKGPLPLAEVLKITWQIGRALDYAHSYTPAVIHRDIKPSNIMIEDSSGRVVMMDFGIAKELGESDLTKAGTMLGTVKYCPPEQIRHEPLDSSADVYALGMVMYEAYTGIQFFAGLGEHEVMGRVLDPACENQPHFTRPAPPAFVALVTKAVAKSRDQRYRRMADLLSDLEASWPGQSEQASILNAATLRVEPQSAGAPDEIKALEEQIYKLQEERQRRLFSQLQAKVREARERAAQEGADQWASSLFQQGLAEEEGGLERFRDRQYVPAQQAYQAAAGLYAQAYEQARTGYERARQEAEHARRRQAAIEEAEAARQRLIEAKQQGVLLRGWAEAAWTKADLAAAEAEMAWQQQAGI